MFNNKKQEKTQEKDNKPKETFFNSTNIIRKFTPDDIDKFGYCDGKVVFKASSYGVDLYGAVPYSHANQHVFLRFLGFDEKNRIIVSSELMIIEKEDVCRAVL